MNVLPRFLLAASMALALPATSLIAQSTSGSSGKGLTEPGPSAAGASKYGTTQNTPSITGSQDRAPAGTPAAKPGGIDPTFHGSALTTEALFGVLDTNKDGQLSREEFAKVHEVMGLKKASQ